MASIPAYDNRNCGTNDADSEKRRGVMMTNKAEDSQDDDSSSKIANVPAAGAAVRGRTIEIHHNLPVAANEDTRN